MRSIVFTSIALAAALAAIPATAQPVRVTGYFGGSSQLVDTETRLGEVSASAAFEIHAAFDSPAPIACSVAWPEGSIRRRFRGIGTIELTCADGSRLDTPGLDFRSGRRGERHQASFSVRFVGLRGCALPIRALGTVRLKGGSLRRFLASGVEPRSGLALDLVCSASAENAGR